MFIELYIYGIVFACALFGKERPLRARVPAAWGMDIGTCTPRAPAPFLLSGPGTTACLRRRLRGALYFVVHSTVFFLCFICNTFDVGSSRRVYLTAMQVYTPVSWSNNMVTSYPSIAFSLHQRLASCLLVVVKVTFSFVQEVSLRLMHR